MSKVLAPNINRDGDTLNPNHLLENFQALKRDYEDATAQRWTHHQFQLEWNVYTHSDGQETRQRFIKTPATWGAWEITKIELVVYAVADEVYDLTISGASAGAETVSVTAGGATTKKHTVEPMSVTCGAATEITFELDCSAATWTLTRGYAIIHCKHDRHQGAVGALESIPSMESAIADDPADLNTFFSTYTTQSTANTGNDEQLRIEHIELTRSAAVDASYDRAYWIPSRGETLKQIDVYASGVSTRTCQIDIRDEGDVSLQTASVTCDGAGSMVKDQGQLVDDTQTQDDPDDTADDYEMRVTAAAVLEIACAVLYWEK